TTSTIISHIIPHTTPCIFMILKDSIKTTITIYIFSYTNAYAIIYFISTITYYFTSTIKVLKILVLKNVKFNKF
ncbi:MAG: hypothetical protein J6Y28_09585, partial [Acholeplasmatales bacterium]|nr:hypothetical protein [Acholeplasmatales bacterium]